MVTLGLHSPLSAARGCWSHNMQRCSAQKAGGPGGRSGLAEELLVQQEDEQVDVHLGFVKHLHDGDSLVLQLEEILII